VVVVAGSTNVGASAANDGMAAAGTMVVGGAAPGS
jgi:hypothetical protein